MSELKESHSSILLSSILSYMDNQDIPPNIVMGLNLPKKGESDEHDQSDEHENKCIPCSFFDLDDNIVFTIYVLVCHIAFNQPDLLKRQFFLHLKSAIHIGKMEFMKSLDAREHIFWSHRMFAMNSINENLLHILAMMEMVRNKETISGKSAKELYDMHTTIYHMLTLDIDDHLCDFNEYITPSSKPPYLNIFLIRYFAMHSISKEDMMSMRFLDAEPTRIMFSSKIRREFRIISPELYTLMAINDKKTREYTERTPDIPKREIVPVIVEKMSQRQKKAAAKAAASNVAASNVAASKKSCN